MNSNNAATSPTLRPDLKLRSSSEGAQITNNDITPARTLSPTSTMSPASSYTSSPPPVLKEHRRALTFHFPRSRSKSPRPPPPVNLSISPPTTLKHAKTSPLPGQSSSHDHHRHRSDGAVPPPPSRSATTPTSPGIEKRDSWLQKKPRYSGSSPGGYGRHANDWLFGGFSITGTVKEVVMGGTRRKEEDKEGTRRT